jgi:lysylphosphatidylglycerol synthetase-like protein (DUF2156 family)
MELGEFLTTFKSVLVKASKDGLASFHTGALIEYIERAERDLVNNNAPIEGQASGQILLRESENHQHERKLEIFRATVNAGQNAIKTAFLLHGGAVVAILAFIGHLASIDTSNIAKLAICILPFSLGVLICAFVAGLTYLTQLFVESGDEKSLKNARNINLFSMGLMFSTYLTFLVGLVITYKVMVSFALTC